MDSEVEQERAVGPVHLRQRQEAPDLLDDDRDVERAAGSRGRLLVSHLQTMPTALKTFPSLTYHRSTGHRHIAAWVEVQYVFFACTDFVKLSLRPRNK